MTGISNYLANAILEHTLRGEYSETEFVQPATVYLALHSSEPDQAGVGGELSGGGYARQSVSFSAPTDGVISNSDSPEFNVPTTTITHFSIWDDADPANCLFTGSVGTPQQVTFGDTYSPQPGALRISRIEG